jgi:hypothetical protein
MVNIDMNSTPPKVIRREVYLEFLIFIGFLSLLKFLSGLFVIILTELRTPP